MAHIHSKEKIMNRLNILIAAGIMLGLSSVSFAKLNVVTTTSDLAALAQEVGGDQVEVVSIAKGYQDPHFIDAKPSYLLKLKKADLFIQVGLELEVGWAGPLLSNARNSKILPGNPGFLDASEGCDILEKQGGVDRSKGDVHPFGNPHYWLDPENGRIMAKTIAARLSQLDPVHASEFNANLAKFNSKLNDKEKEWNKLAEPLKGMKVVFYHNSWSNFTKRFGLVTVNFIEPKPGIPPSPAHIHRLTQLIKNEGVKVLLIEPYFDSKLPEKLAHDTGSKLLIFAPSVGAIQGVDTYTDLFDHNLKLLADAAGGKQ